MTKKLPKTLYHYCSVNTFFNIFENRSIWLSDVEKSNDTLELSYMKKEYAKYAQTAIYAFVDYHKQNSIDYEPRRLYALQQVMTDASQLAITKVWTFCLSEKGDLLSQWRGYADDGYGVSVGFKTKKLYEIINTLSKSTLKKGQLLFLDKIEYSEKHMKEKIEEIFNINECAKCQTVKDLQQQFVNVISKIETMTPCYKNSSFKEEKEWRIILESLIGETCSYTNLNESIDIAKIGKFSYCVSNQNLVSHFELEFVDLKKAIDKIILGPKCKISVDDMRYYLVSKGLLKNNDDKSILIETSCSSYR